MRLRRTVIPLLILLGGPAIIRASDEGNQVVVVYNSRLPESKAVADYYATRREVPHSQVWGFKLSTNEEISRREFKNSLQEPLLEKLESKNLWQFGPGEITGTNGQPVHFDKVLKRSGIRYLVLCYGVPLKIASDPEAKEAVAESMRPELRRNEAAVDSELATLPSFHLDTPISGPLRNPLYGTTNQTAFDPTNGTLIVARLDGPTSEIARGLVDKALEAERNGLWGRAYFDLRSVEDPNYKLGDDWIRSASEVCRVLGFETILDTNGPTFPASFPMSQIAFYCGWYDVNASGPFAQPNVEFMPGAFAYHLHSFSAESLRSTNSHWVGPFLAKGVTATMGCVYEPYLTATPDISVFMSRLIFHGFNFGESAYASQPVDSWMTTVVGDPLYRPFGRPAPALHLQLERERNPLVEWSHLRVVNLNLAKRFPAGQALNYLDQIPVTKKSAVLMEKFADLCAALGKPSSSLQAYRDALELNPSPLQRVRLRLTLGEKLAEQHEDQAEYEDYEKLTEESPNYPGLIDVCRKLTALARKLDKPADVAKWGLRIQELSPPPPVEPVATNHADVTRSVAPQKPVADPPPVAPPIAPPISPGVGRR